MITNATTSTIDIDDPNVKLVSSVSELRVSTEHTIDELKQKHKDGGRIAIRIISVSGNDFIPSSEWQDDPFPKWLDKPCIQYGLIDTTPIIDWNVVDFPFFVPYGGLPSTVHSDRSHVFKSITDVRCVLDYYRNAMVRESPIYFWLGDIQSPVPHNVQVEVYRRIGTVETLPAGKVDWKHPQVYSSDDVIGFKLTGYVYA